MVGCPQKQSWCASFPWKERQNVTHWGGFGGQKGVPNGQFGATNSLVYLFPLSVAVSSGTKIQPKEEVFGRISLRTSGQKLRSGPPNAGKKQAFWDGHPAQTSMKKLRSEKLRADFSFPISEAPVCQLFWDDFFVKTTLQGKKVHRTLVLMTPENLPKEKGT